MSTLSHRNKASQRKPDDVPVENRFLKNTLIFEKKEEVKKTPMQIAQEKYSKFFTRSIWGLIMIIAWTGILYSDHYLVCLFVVILQIIVFKELIALRYAEAKEKNLYGFRTVHWFVFSLCSSSNVSRYFLFVTFFYVYGVPFLQHSHRFFSNSVTLELLLRYQIAISFALYVVGFIAFIVTLKKNFYKYQFGQLTWTLMTLLLVVGQSNFVIQNILRGMIWFLHPCSLIIFNDIMAYICGMLLGRRFINRPLTSLSPNKTWEGFIGAGIGTLLWSYFVRITLILCHYLFIFFFFFFFTFSLRAF
jgi:phosphatidate cytidylyltransferase